MSLNSNSSSNDIGFRCLFREGLDILCQRRKKYQRCSLFSHQNYDLNTHNNQEYQAKGEQMQPLRR